jgi:hypothetical protein
VYALKAFEVKLKPKRDEEEEEEKKSLFPEPEKNQFLTPTFNG